MKPSAQNKGGGEYWHFEKNGSIKYSLGNVIKLSGGSNHPLEVSSHGF